MWTLSLNDILSAKEEINGRRAAIRARYEKDLKSVEDELTNITTLENAAKLFVQARHQAEVEDEPRPDPIDPAEIAVTESGSSFEAENNDEAAAAETESPAGQRNSLSTPGMSSAASEADRKVNRWRIR